MSIIVAGIHTEIGKTVTSAVICQALGYDYWKPVQAGDLDQSDSITVQGLVSNPTVQIHPERYRLKKPASPHHSAALENITIRKEDFVLPEGKNPILVETAGGLMSPLADNLLNIDLIEYLNLPVVLVSNNYLGSINHTLLSWEALKSRKIPTLGLIFTGEEVPSSREVILSYTGLPLLFSIPQFPALNKNIIYTFTVNHSINLHES